MFSAGVEAAIVFYAGVGAAVLFSAGVGAADAVVAAFGAAVVTLLCSTILFQTDSFVEAEDTTPGRISKAAHAEPVGSVHQLRSIAVSKSARGIPWWHPQTSNSFSVSF